MELTLFYKNVPVCITFLFYRITEIAGVYGEGEFSASYAYPYIVAINNASQFVSNLKLTISL